MRTFGPNGKCSKCGRQGPVWRSRAIVLDFGMPGMAPMEPAMEPPLCDDCEHGLPPSPPIETTPEQERKIEEIIERLCRGPHRD
jgi:hypothetical protein